MLSTPSAIVVRMLIWTIFDFSSEAARWQKESQNFQMCIISLVDSDTGLFSPFWCDLLVWKQQLYFCLDQNSSTETLWGCGLSMLPNKLWSGSFVEGMWSQSNSIRPSYKVYSSSHLTNKHSAGFHVMHFSSLGFFCVEKKMSQRENTPS